MCRTVCSVVVAQMPKAMPAMMIAVRTGLRLMLFVAMRVLQASMPSSLCPHCGVEHRGRALHVDDLAVEEMDLARGPRRALRRVRDHDDGRAAAVDVVEARHDLAHNERGTC